MDGADASSTTCLNSLTSHMMLRADLFSTCFLLFSFAGRRRECDRRCVRVLSPFSPLRSAARREPFGSSFSPRLSVSSHSYRAFGTSGRAECGVVASRGCATAATEFGTALSSFWLRLLSLRERQKGSSKSSLRCLRAVSVPFVIPAACLSITISLWSAPCRSDSGSSTQGAERSVCAWLQQRRGCKGKSKAQWNCHGATSVLKAVACRVCRAGTAATPPVPPA